MATKKQILSNPLDYSVEELYEAIKDGVITYDELCEYPDFPRKRRNQLSTLINGAEDEDWEIAKKNNNEEAYYTFIEKYPQSKYVSEARKLIENLHQQQQEKARREAERAEWGTVPQWDIDAVRNYIHKHPDSPYLPDANKILNEYAKQEEERIWKNVNKEDETSLKDYIERHPDGLFAEEARRLLKEMEPEPIEDLLETIRYIEADKSLSNPIADITQKIVQYLSKGKGAVSSLMREIKKNKNLLPVGVVQALLKQEPELQSKFKDAVGADFMKALNNPYSNQSPLPTVVTPDKIDRISTEFYFWGIPASGKTCLMASLLSAANAGNIEDVKGMRPNETCSGYEYLTYLMDFFSGEGNILRLMPGNGQGSVAEMGFDLIDSKKHIHPITFIDMPGEAFKAMHKELSHKSNNPFKSDLDVVYRLLVDEKKANNNQKVHIFVVEYGAHNKKDGEGVSQQMYLQSAATYIKSKKIFEKKTDMICIIFTKADLTEGGPENFDWKSYLENYYNGFYSNLCEICETNEINNGEPVRFWFSIGEVCFRAYCKYNEEAAHKVLNFIVDRTWKHSKFHGIFSK